MTLYINWFIIKSHRSKILNCVNCSSVGGAAVIEPEGRGFNSHPGQSFSLSLCGPNCIISRANVHMFYMVLKLINYSCTDDPIRLL